MLMLYLARSAASPGECGVWDSRYSSSLFLDDALFSAELKHMLHIASPTPHTAHRIFNGQCKGTLRHTELVWTADKVPLGSLPRTALAAALVFRQEGLQ